jgi:hypothetical protein
MQTPQDPKPAGKELSPEVRNLLGAIGRGLGTIAVYGPKHPSVDLIVNDTYDVLKDVLKKQNISVGSFNGKLTVDEAPVNVTDMPIRTLEKRLTSMKISHLVLTAGLSKEELKNLLSALCETTNEKMKAALSSGGVKHIELEDVKYVTLRDGEKKTGKGGSGESNIPQAQINQIIAFLKGEPGATASSAELKRAISDPQKLGQMILEAAAVRQKAASMNQGESLADIVVGCLRRTYDGLSKESVFESAQGKATLAKTMLLVEKTIIEKIRGPEGAETPGLDRRIMAGIREMEKERQLDMLSTHYAEQCAKRDKTEKTIAELIRQIGPEKAKEQLMAAGIPAQDCQRLIKESMPPSPSMTGGGSGGGVDITAIASVLDKLDGLLQLAEQNPAAAKNTIQDARQGINEYASQADAKISEIEGKVQQSGGQERDKLILEISKLTLSLMQPLTVINGSIEAAMMTPDPDLHKELLELAHESGQSLDKMTKRMIELTNYPELNEADGHLNEWKQP